MNSSEGEVERKTPIGQVREERKGLFGLVGHAMATIPAKDGEEGGECVN
jgi:hypothetical protein